MERVAEQRGYKSDVALHGTAPHLGGYSVAVKYLTFKPRVRLVHSSMQQHAMQLTARSAYLPPEWEAFFKPRSLFADSSMSLQLWLRTESTGSGDPSRG